MSPIIVCSKFAGKSRGREVAENGSTGGAFLPMLTLGVPGDAATAVLMGVPTIHDPQLGPMPFRERPNLVHRIFAA